MIDFYLCGEIPKWGPYYKEKVWFSFINLFYLFIYAHTHVCLCVYVCAHRCAFSYLKRPEEGAISLGAEVSIIHEPHDVDDALWLSPTLVCNYWASLRHLSPSSTSSSETCLSPTAPESLLWGVTCLFFPSSSGLSSHPFKEPPISRQKSLVISTNKCNFNCTDIAF